MISAIQAELSRTIAFAQEERIAALRHITTERIAAVKELHDAIVQERRAMTQDLDRMSVNVVDHAFLRAAQLCGAVLVVAFIGMVVLLLLVRRLFKASLADAVARLVRETHGGPPTVCFRTVRATTSTFADDRSFHTSRHSTRQHPWHDDSRSSGRTSSWWRCRS